MEKKKEIIVIGHKNPDTDSICSAISYAYLKNAITGTKQYVPRRCGEVSKETAYVLDQFGIEAPEYIKDVRTQVQDIELRTTAGISGGISIRKAYTTMKAEKAFTLPVVSEENHLQGLITIGDIAASDMDVYDNRIVSKAATPYQNIVDTLDGTVLCGDISGCFTGGKVTIAANSPDLMQEYISAGDLVIMGNRFESQFFAVETGVSCIVLCTHNQVNETIMQRAREKGTVIISSPYDSYTVARLINQSMPVEYFMTKEKLLTFHMDDYANDVKEVMSKTRHRYFPVVGEDDRYLGLISKRNFLDSNHKQVILVDHNEKSQAVDGIEFADILEKHDLPAQKQAQFLETMEKQIDKLDFLMQSLIKMSRLETGTFVLRVQDTDIAGTIAEAISPVWAKAEKKKIRIETECGSGILIRHDPKWTAEALGNILDNAVKYTSHGGRICIRVRPWQIYTRIDISDTGSGIDSRHYHDIFKRFYRAPEVSAQEGVGLGLYLAQEIIRQEKGYITVKSEKGRGTVFSVFLLS